MGRKKKLNPNDLLPQPVIPGIDWNEFEDVEYKPRPVNLKLAKIRSVKRQMREIVSDLLNSENDNGDSRAEVILDQLILQAEKGNTKAVEMILKLLGELEPDKTKVDVNLPSIKIVVDKDSDGIRNTEKIEETDEEQNNQCVSKDDNTGR